MATTKSETAQTSLLLQQQLKDLLKHPVEGFSVGLVDENNIYEWSVNIIGPMDTLYEWGCFNAIMRFPEEYPFRPPSLNFVSEMWHPNVYPDGEVCISILHPPGEDPNGYELASERWSPVQTELGVSAAGRGELGVSAAGRGELGVSAAGPGELGVSTAGRGG
ncbi:ubiquitin-conjugating enzyme E2 7-like [Macadamia integrifolia]|uniref:ubiquitin-conjugating enzyme E2 7-like n=1 Tax=Macadamia integrifolia TaxID=60698 RepID=UPI001C501E7F|nr:ubiquitin-conjugating enzyme E2 7-like [Macadamia integrifolia]